MNNLLNKMNNMVTKKEENLKIKNFVPLGVLYNVNVSPSDSYRYVVVEVVSSLPVTENFNGAKAEIVGLFNITRRLFF